MLPSSTLGQLVTLWMVFLQSSSLWVFSLFYRFILVLVVFFFIVFLQLLHVKLYFPKSLVLSNILVWLFVHYMENQAWLVKDPSMYSLPSMLFSKVFKNSKVHAHCKRASYQCWCLLGNPWPGSEMSQNTVQESLDYKMVDSLLGFGVPQQKEQAASIDSCRSIDSIVFSLV